MRVIIEIPKGDDRRRHIRYDKSGFIDLGAIKDIIPVNNGIMPVHYGYIPETLNEKEGDEIDVLVLSDNDFSVGQEIEVEPIALIRREDGDDKIIAVDKTRGIIQQWDDVPEIEKKLIKDFFGYHHRLLSFDNSECAIEYIGTGYEYFYENK